MRKPNTRKLRHWAAFLLAAILMMAIAPTALADTDAATPKITQQPDQLILQLGTRWAGVEFELRTDAGIFPAPVVVDETGVLRMDLGGSTTYTLSCIESSIPIPDPQPEPEPDTAGTQAAPNLPVESEPQQPEPQQPETSPTPEDSQQSTPIWPLVVFLMGLSAAGSALIVLQVNKRRRQMEYDEWDDDEEE